MNLTLTVLWPKIAAPQIDEIMFSFNFCRRMSKRLCMEAGLRCHWIEYTEDSNLRQVLSQVIGDRVLIVTHPEILLSPAGLSVLLDCLEHGHPACGPVYNRSVLSHQVASLPLPYLDIKSYLEIATILSTKENGNCIAVDALDPGCVLYRLDFLKTRWAELPPLDISKSIQKINSRGGVVATGALIHSGFVKSFEAERDDLVRLVPDGVRKALDIGCAMGGYGKALREVRPEVSLTGIEPNPLMAEAAGAFYDEIIELPVEQADLTCDFDLINCGDILEHLVDPWGMLKRLNGLLRPGGYLVMSIPNVGHWSVAKNLLQGGFEYIPLGLLCVSHVRWFTESSVRQALEDSGFDVDIFEREQIPPTPKGDRFIHHMCRAGYGDEESLKTNEFIIRAAKRSDLTHS